MDAVTKKCLTCGVEFTTRHTRKLYCCRKCFKKAYTHREKAKELSAVKKYPIFTCPSCGQCITLDFDPVIDNMKWLKYNCNGCNTLMIDVSDQIITDEIVNKNT